MIAHADRLWRAECENAQRLSNRHQVMAGVIITLLGLGFFGFQWGYQTPIRSMTWWPITIAINGLLILAVGLYSVVLARLFWRGRPKLPMASDLMAILPGDVGRPIRLLVYAKVSRAYLDLRRRNEAFRETLDKAQDWFAYAIGATLLAIILYLFGSIPAKINASGADHGTDINTSRRFDSATSQGSAG